MNKLRTRARTYARTHACITLHARARAHTQWGVEALDTIPLAEVCPGLDGARTAARFLCRPAVAQTVARLLLW
jgi:hypothetical protein